VLVADSGVNEDVDWKHSSHPLSEDEGEGAGGGFASTLVVLSFLLILMELASENFEHSEFISS
jgi:hypothetical protein